MANVIQWVNERLADFGFKKIKSLPALNEVKKWRGSEITDGVVQLFFSSHGTLTVYMHDLVTHKTDISQLDGVDAKEYANQAYVSEEDVQRILKESKEESLNDEKHLNEIANIQSFLDKKVVEKNLENKDIKFLKDWYGNERIVKEFDQQVVKVLGVVIEAGDSVLASLDLSGFVVERKNSSKSYIGGSEKAFLLDEKKKSNWAFFSNKIKLMSSISDISLSRVVHVDEFSDVGNILGDMDVVKKCFLLDQGESTIHSQKFIVLHPPVEFSTWEKYIRTCDIAHVRAYIRSNLI